MGISCGVHCRWFCNRFTFCVLPSDPLPFFFTFAPNFLYVCQRSRSASWTRNTRCSESVSFFFFRSAQKDVWDRRDREQGSKSTDTFFSSFSIVPALFLAVAPIAPGGGKRKEEAVRPSLQKRLARLATLADHDFKVGRSFRVREKKERLGSGSGCGRKKGLEEKKKKECATMSARKQRVQRHGWRAGAIGAGECCSIGIDGRRRARRKTRAWRCRRGPLPPWRRPPRPRGT